MATAPSASQQASILQLSGSIDYRTARDLRQQLRARACDCTPVLTLDLSGVDRMDAAGAATLLEHHHNTRRFGGRMVLSGANVQVANLLDLLGLRDVFELTPPTVPRELAPDPIEAAI